MREPPLGLEEVPDPNLEVFFDDILSAPSTEELILGLYEQALPALSTSLERHLNDTNPLTDHPSVRVCRFALLELNDMLDFGDNAIAALIGDPCRERVKDWLALLDECLAAAGGLDGITRPTAKTIQRRHSERPYEYDRRPRRDERFPDPYNMGVNAEVFLYEPRFAPQPKTLMMFYKRLREIDVPEMMASIIIETTSKPWAYYRDIRASCGTRPVAMIGEVGFTISASIGAEVDQLHLVPGAEHATQADERHAVLLSNKGSCPETASLNGKSAKRPEIRSRRCSRLRLGGRSPSRESVVIGTELRIRRRRFVTAMNAGRGY